MEDAIARQIDRIAFLRSTGQPWDEAVYQLRDMVVGLEDEEFWDGIPEDVRKSLKKETDEWKRQEITKACAVEGWNGYPVRAFRSPSGQPIYMPTPENLSCAYRIVMRLLSRKGIAWRTRRISKLERLEGDEKDAQILELPAEEEVITNSVEVVQKDDV